MPLFIPLQAVPNQAFSIPLEGIFYEIEIKETAGCMGLTISADSLLLLNNTRLLANIQIIPYFYKEVKGNFVLTTTNESVAYYDQFNVTQFLYYITQAELEAVRERN